MIENELAQYSRITHLATQLSDLILYLEKSISRINKEFSATMYPDKDVILDTLKNNITVKNSTLYPDILREESVKLIEYVGMMNQHVKEYHARTLEDYYRIAHDKEKLATELGIKIHTS